MTFREVGALTLATVKIKGGSAYFLTNKLSRGLHNIEAQYGGDAQHWPQTAGVVQSMTQR